MKAAQPMRCLRTCATAALALAWCGGAHAAVIDAELEAELAARAPHEEVAVIVYLSGQVDRRLYETRGRSKLDGRLVRALRQNAALRQAPHKAFLRQRGAHRLRELWAVNGIAVAARPGVIRELSRLAGVTRIRPDSILQAPAVGYGDPAPPEWNLDAVSARPLWMQGYTGSGVVVANMDTGVDPAHPDLAGKWRGGSNSWFDPHGEHATPYDPSGHGTQTMSIMVGGAAGGSDVGVAPGASWIAAKLYNDAGQASYSDIHLAFQWLLDPDGDPATPDAPDVVNASWGLVGSAGQCIPEFAADIGALKTAGIAVTFAAGNDGPAPLTSLSPANNATGFASGAIDSTLALANFSARGPAACDGAIYPKLSAPGVGIHAADLSFGGMPLYTTVSGTSYAAPHTAGAMALLMNAYPGVGIADLETALTQSAQDLGVAGADNGYGHGLVDALAAYNDLHTRLGSPPVVTSTPLLAATQGLSYAYRVTAADADGGALSFSLEKAPAGMTIKAVSATVAWIGWRPGNAQVGTQAVIVRATDAGGLFARQSFSVAVANVNDAPQAANDAYAVIKGGTLNVAAPGVLANDSDPDVGDTLTVANYGNPKAGTLAGNSDGSFSYTPNAGFTGMDSFAYRARDNHGLASKQAAWVSIAVRVNRAPQTVDDAVTVASNTTQVIDVLANDSDPDTAIDASNRIDPATVFIPNAGKPNMGGTVVVNADGTISYTPRLNFTGSELFMYAVRDTYLTPAISKAAYVRVNVQ